MSQTAFDPSLLSRNCEALAKKNPALARAVKTMDADPGVEIAPSRNGEPTLSVDGRQMLSRYDPIRDIDRLVQKTLAKKPVPQALVVLGFELGLVARRLLQQTRSQVYVIEPRPGVLRAAFGAADLTDVLVHKRFQLIESPKKLFLNIHYTIGMKPDVAVLGLPGIMKYFGEELEHVHQRLTDLVRNQDIQMTTILVKNREWFTYLLGNFRHYVGLPSVGRLLDLFQNKPAVVVSAGPSLDKNVHLLEKWKGRGVIISVGTSLRKCVRTDVVPDFTIALESNDIFSQFEGIDEIKDGFTVFQSKCHPRLWTVPSRATFVYANTHPDSKWIMSLLNRPKSTLLSGGSVSTAAFSLALALGCNPVVMIGQDLAFGEAGESHAEGIGTGGVENVATDRMEKALGKQATDLHLVLVDGYHGGKVVTRTNLRNYLLWFEQNIPIAVEAGFRVINATEGGAMIHGVEQMPLAEATEMFLSEPLDTVEMIAACAEPETVDFKRVAKEVAKVQRDLRELVDKAKKGCEVAVKVQKLLDAKPQPTEKINKAIRRISRDEARIKHLLKSLDPLLAVAANKALLIVTSCFDYEGLDREQEVRLNMKHTATMYNALIEAGTFIQKKLSQLQDDIAAMTD